MGGNALKNIITKRLSSTEYFLLEQDVIKKLTLLFPDASVKAIAAYKTKSDFGDMDVLINSESLPQNWKTLVSEIFQSKESISNGEVFSTDYKQFQIDLIVIKKQYFDIACSYFSFNDLGNLIGRVAHKMGFKYGHTGLIYPYRNGNYLFKEIEVSTDISKILPFLGYDHQQFKNGFNKLTDIFNYTISTPFFNPNIYLLENRNHRAKTRDSKRKTYMEFLKWIQTKQDLTHFNFPLNKNDWLKRAYEHFPSFKDEYSNTHTAFLENKIIKTKFNGEIIHELTNLSDKNLGKFISEFKTHTFNNDALTMHKWILETPQPDINTNILNFFEKNKHITKIKKTI